MAKPRIAILGSRGIPAQFGGFETVAEELTTRLVETGFDITVFCHGSQTYKEPLYKGVRLVHINTPSIKGMRTVWFDTMSLLRALLGHYDVIYWVGYNAAFLFPFVRLSGANLWVNMDGLGWKRAKWNRSARLYLRAMEWLAAKVATGLIADSDRIADYLESTYGVRDKTKMIPYGAYLVESSPGSEILNDFSVKPDDYYLIVCRLEPENHVLEILQGFVSSNTTKKLIVVGDRNSGTAYVCRLLDAQDERIRFVGTIFDEATLTTLRYHCAAYLHGHSVGGTNPSLLEAMACGNFVIAHDNVFNREVTNEQAWFFRGATDIADLIGTLEREGTPEGASERSRDVVRQTYSWSRIAGLYDSMWDDVT